jgi:23S rRNA (uracil1939-C5)-methyltransferase
VEGFLLKAGVKAEVLPLLSAGETAGYRNKVQYPTRDGKLGYYANHSHRVVEKEGCALHHPAMEPVIRTVAEFIKSEKISCYEEESGKGLLRHVYLRTNRDGSEMLLTLVINGEKFPKAEKLVALLKERHPSVTGVLLNINKKKTNVILGSEYLLLAGKDTMTDSLLGCEFEMAPASFYQVNRKGTELLYSKVIEFADLQGGEIVADLFCGIGTIGICLAKNAEVKELVGIEVVPEAVENAKKNAARNGIENAKFYCGDANHPALKKADVVIVDPPRKGLDKGLIEHLTALSPRKIVYVSCDPATLARDLAVFYENGWQIGTLQPVDMFPRTGHVESVVSLTRGFDVDMRR